MQKTYRQPAAYQLDEETDEMMQKLLRTLRVLGDTACRMYAAQFYNQGN
jgi:hypothetical protein